MDRAMWTAASGMHAQQTRIDTISNNLSNVNTTGFKQSRADFQDQMYQVQRMPGASSSAAGTQVPTGIQVGLGVRTGAVSPTFEQGNLENTGNNLDLAIEGRGFFQVQLPNGDTGYTRAGNFSIDNQGRIVTPDGNPLLSGITIPPNATGVNISKDGTVDVRQPGNAQPTTVGQIQLATFVNPAGLKAEGGNIFLETGASGAPQQGLPGANGAGTLQQGFLEKSNVSVVREMVNMISGQRAYEVNSKAIKTSDQMLQMANNLKR
ncbi:flagellar basal-body rod protein FlgG [Thiohalorhabdus methylotrophus]|uniref:Flagellar basal-body rod protein FlgF n=1 Tax=Thiohalorhabdus methylotrophus TaxID=3242694 RepID=A0ABV4TY11_9GAMM